MHPISWIKGLGAGALGMFFLDPQQGRRRQAQAVDQCAHLAATWVRWFDRASRDLSNRARGAWHEVLGALDTHPATDEVLTARVRSKLGRAVSHPRAIEADVADGVVSLRGPVLADEAECLLACVRSVPGVSRVEDELSRHDEDEGLAELQGGRREDDELPIFARSPGMRLAAGALGTLLMANCAVRRRPTSILLGTVGFALLVQAVSTQPPTAQRAAKPQAGRKRRRAEGGAGAEAAPNSAAEESSHGDESILRTESLHGAAADDADAVDEDSVAATSRATPSRAIGKRTAST